MHNVERDDVEKELAHADSLEAARLMRDRNVASLRIEQRNPGKPIVCEVIGSAQLELVVVIPAEKGTYTLQALRPLPEGESITLKRRDNGSVVAGTLHNCRKAQRASDHPNLHLAGLSIPPGAL